MSEIFSPPPNSLLLYFIFMSQSIIVLHFMSEHYCTAFHVRALLYFISCQSIIVLHFMSEHYCTSFHVRALLYCISCQSIIILHFMSEHYCTAFHVRALLYFISCQSIIVLHFMSNSHIMSCFGNSENLSSFMFSLFSFFLLLCVPVSLSPPLPFFKLLSG